MDKEWSKFKLVEGRSVRKFNDDKKVEEVCKANGYTDIYRNSLITLTEMEKLKRKEEFNTLLGNLVYKLEGKPSLVPRSDKRKELVLHNVKQEFGGKE